MTPVVLATTGLSSETELVSGLQVDDGYAVRCRAADVVELITVVVALRTGLVLVSPRFPRASLDIVRRIVELGATCMAVVDSGDTTGEQIARRWRIPVAVLRPGRGVGEVLAAALADGGQSCPATSRAGSVIAVVGPPGSPGRTTLAVNLASELAGDPSGTHVEGSGAATSPTGAADGTPVGPRGEGGGHVRGRALLLDLDLSAPAIAFACGVPDRPSGLIAACAQADAGLLDAPSMLETMVTARDGVMVCTGIPEVSRAREIRRGPLGPVLDLAAATASTVVIDCGPADPGGGSAFVLEAVLPRADEIVVVAAASALGVRRLTQWLPAVRPLVGGSVTLAWNMLRPPHAGGALGVDPLPRLQGPSAAAGTGVRVVGLPWDPTAAAAMDRSPGALALTAPSCRLRRALRRFATTLGERRGR